MIDIKIAMIGYGNVGKAFASILMRKEEYIKSEFGAWTRIVAVCTGSKGGYADERGIDTSDQDYSLFSKEFDSFKIIDNVDYDVMIELTPINIMTGQPATEHIRHALNRGKHVITAM